MNPLEIVALVLGLLFLIGAITALVLASQRYSQSRKSNRHHHTHKNTTLTIGGSTIWGKEPLPLVIYPTGPVSAFIDTADGYKSFNIFQVTFVLFLFILKL